MSYKAALEKAWSDLAGLTNEKALSVELLSDTYDIDISARTVMSRSCNIPAKEHTIIILLHYLIRKSQLNILPNPSSEWISFNQIEGGEGYYPTFKKRTMGVVLRKYGQKPEALLDVLKKFSGRKGNVGDVSIVLEPLKNVPILISIFKGDDEFGPEANINFDRTIHDIFCTEDIVVLTEMLVHSI